MSHGIPAYIDLTFDGETQPYTYQWYKDGIITNLITDDVSISEIGEYNVLITDANGCRFNSDNWIVTGLANIDVTAEDDDKIYVYPNPTSSILHIKNPTSAIMSNMYLLDGAGKNTKQHRLS